jgi:hypothetical protein
MSFGYFHLGGMQQRFANSAKVEQTNLIVAQAEVWTSVTKRRTRRFDLHFNFRE